MANAQDFIFWNSVFYIPLAVLIIYRYTIQGLGLLRPCHVCRCG